MDTASLKSFATSARLELIREVDARITAVLSQTSPERVEQPRAVTALEHAISSAGDGDTGTAHVAERVAYTWFNRIVALRFMDANGYTNIGIVSPAADQVGQPEILAAAKRGQIDGGIVRGANSATIMGLLNGTRQPRPGVDAQAEAYTLLLADYCRFWNQAMPFMFEREGDFTELLIPANLLAEDSVLNRSVKALTQEVCRDVEVIGWLYQYYISERKDEVFAGFKKNKKAGADEIPAATQLFTPHWIVRYLVENSVGRLWMLNHPESRIVDKMDYYIAPVDEETDFLKITTPEELTVIDPACGSGHMLTYAFDLLYLIYEEEGYTPSQIPGLILTHNLYGTEIDPRAGALAAFALTMKAVARRKLFLKNPVAPNICVVEALSFRSDEIVVLTAAQGEALVNETYWNQFEFADTLGSLIRPDLAQTLFAKSALEQTNLENDIIYSETAERARKVIRQAETLSNSYAVVVANPPYMGSKQMNGQLSQFMKDEFPDSKSDLFAGFIERCTNLAGPRGTVAMITMQSWMFLSSYEKLRGSLLTEQRITSMLHLGARAFDSIGGEVVSSTAFVLANVPPEARGTARKRAGTFIRLVDGTSEAEKAAALSTVLDVRSKEAGFHLVSDSDFAAIPGSPIVYWLSEKMRAAFQDGKPLAEVAEPRQGMATADNARYVRQWWEVSKTRTAFDCPTSEAALESRARWFPYTDGGEFRRWYGNRHVVVNWENDGRDLREFERSVIRNPTFYFRESVTWSAVGSGVPSFRAVPAGSIFSNAGMSTFATPEQLIELVALCNSTTAERLFGAIAPTLNLGVGEIGKLPVTTGAQDLVQTIPKLVAGSKEDWDNSETSWGFSSSPLVDVGKGEVR
ncbi:MAG TPA: BREX-1 system adenine-specific DNA-methyltransferase PglX [Glutamicibacter sp.]|uniref:BREX-1 system adenine-specific DNA-methyltransferase PglX n=1 Tax=Glutamicibacter arilaitensis TaxID=256701 RepID=UPI000EE6205E|nr:BREX-1 system adenine-specific DNA-methyltransferase PglX [Glutamicibacter arilaitensis]HCM95431.1 BREX-1 system adenine-specific DNA-methyltransferase PglX [Glutamicibacter sp.]